jgi:hypothetical protein
MNRSDAMTPLMTQALCIATEHLSEVNQLIAGMRPPLGPPGRPQCALFLTIVEQFECTIRLANAGLITHSAVHVRSMLEATADLHLLGRDSQHVKRMQYEQARGEKRFYYHMLASQALPSSVRKMIDDRMEACLARYRPLHAGVSKNMLSQAESFAAADMDFVTGLYTMLCAFTHNDLSALALRHQGERSLTHRAAAPDEVAFLILSLASTAVLHASHPMGGVAAFPAGEFAARFSTMSELHEKMSDLRPTTAPQAPKTGNPPEGG